MTKKTKPEDRPVVEANLIPILQSRAAHRSRFIASAEKALAEQRATIKMFREAIGQPFTNEQQEQISKVLNLIRDDIKSLAHDQKVDRVTLKALHSDAVVINYLQGMIDDVRGVLA